MEGCLTLGGTRLRARAGLVAWMFPSDETSGRFHVGQRHNIPGCLPITPQVSIDSHPQGQLRERIGGFKDIQL